MLSLLAIRLKFLYALHVDIYYESYVVFYLGICGVSNKWYDFRLAYLSMKTQSTSKLYACAVDEQMQWK